MAALGVSELCIPATSLQKTEYTWWHHWQYCICQNTKKMSEWSFVTILWNVHLTYVLFLNGQFVMHLPEQSTDYHTYKCKQDAQLWQRDRAAGCIIVFAKSRRLELGDNILRTI